MCVCVLNSCIIHNDIHIQCIHNSGHINYDVDTHNIMQLILYILSNSDIKYPHLLSTLANSQEATLQCKLHWIVSTLLSKSQLLFPLGVLTIRV